MLIALSIIALVGIGVTGLVPSRLVADKENPRLGVEQPAPYARVPASVSAVKDRVSFGEAAGVESFPPEGDVFFVTISEPEQSALSWWLGRDSPAATFLTEEDKYGYQTPQQQRSVSLEQMNTSEQVAQYVALDRLGFDVSILPGEVLIQDMVCLEANEEGTECLEWSPSDEMLDPGDRLVRAEGTKLETVEDLAEVLEGRQPGDMIDMTVVRKNASGKEQTLDVEVELTASPDDPERAIVGFFPFDTRQVELPFEVSIDTGGIGGPSAGLAFTLTLIDELSMGELTGGGRVAVTGTIDLEGNVGPIGGLVQKASAVRQTGVELFLVPARQSDEDIAGAREVVGADVEIVPIDTLDEALQVLSERGGDPIPE